MKKLVMAKFILRMLSKMLKKWMLSIMARSSSKPDDREKNPQNRMAGIVVIIWVKVDG